PRRRHAEARGVGGDAQVGLQRHADAAADAEALDHGDGRLADLAELGVRQLGDPVIFGDRLRRGALLLELRDVGAGNEGLVAGAAQHDDADLGVARKMIENHRHRLPHVERHGVAPLGIVEDHPADRTVLLGDQALARGNHRGTPHAIHAIAPLARKPAIALSSYPSSRSTASVCSPRSGVALRICEGVRLKVTGWPTTSMRPRVGCSTGWAMARWRTCGSAKTSSIL